MTRIYVGPKAIPELLDAVSSAGAEIATDPAEASAIVWFGGSPKDFGEFDHDGIRWVQLPSAGVEGWFAAGPLPAGKQFTSAVGSYAESVAEHSLALMLAGARRLPELARRRSWTRVTSASLFDSTVGIVGAGGIGKALIDLLVPFRATVLAVNRSGNPVPGAQKTLTPDGLDEVLRESQFVVIGAPATPQTRHLIGRRELSLMRPDSWLVNIARGSLVDTDALVEALRNGEIGGAALDVTDPEPLPDGHPLWTLDNALITPHSANPEHLLLPNLVRRVHGNVRHYLAGEPLDGIVDITHGY
jgi:phosphoglycerate dehydrogenase-like enzyme